MTDVEVQLRLVEAWQLRGDVERALKRCQALLEAAPASIPVHIKLAELARELQQTDHARQILERAAQLAPDDPAVRRERERLDSATHTRLARAEQRACVRLHGGPAGKLDLRGQFVVETHRSGWRVAIDALLPLHSPNGIRFDGFIESNFAWHHPFEGCRPQHVLDDLKRRGTYATEATAEERGVIPYLAPWVGFMHNPPQMPAWFHPKEAPQVILAKDVWKRSAEHCKGLFALSEYHARWLRDETGLPVTALLHPTELDVPPFSMERFVANPDKKIVQVGWWLRRQNAIYQLPVPRENPVGYRKARLVTQFFDSAHVYLKQLIERERAEHDLQIPSRFAENTGEIPYLDNARYDALLSANLVFVSLYDVSGCNVLTECVARGTPLLINRLPAVVEYLGEDYPFYFETLEEAAEKALDLDGVEACHRFLTEHPVRPKLTPEHFFETFRKSRIYGELPPC